LVIFPRCFGLLVELRPIPRTWTPEGLALILLRSQSDLDPLA
jgi:hypothetical protein